jgi:hypothetical protein
MEHDENIQDIDLVNNEEVIDNADDTEQELEELRAFKANALKKQAIATRLAKKNNTPIIKTNLDTQLEQDIAEFKFERKVVKFAEENGITRGQAEKVLTYKPNATAEDLNDPFIKAGIEALAKANEKEAINDKNARNIPSGRNSISSTPSKPLSEMTKEEKEAWYRS